MLVTKDRIMTGTEARSFLGDIQARSQAAAAVREAGRPVELLSERFEKLVRGLPQDRVAAGLLRADVADALGISMVKAFMILRGAGWFAPDVPGRSLKRWYPPWAPRCPHDRNENNSLRVPAARPEWWVYRGEWRP